MQKKKRKYIKSFASYLLAFLLLIFSGINLISVPIAKAVTVTGYTSVLGDLMIDDNFSKEDYPEDNSNNNLEIIQIAESTGGELFIYTYQPNVKIHQYELTTISISQTLYDNAKWQLYNLKLLDSDGVFAKYKVCEFDLKADVVRYYDVSEVHRKFIEDFDKQPDNGNITTEVAIGIGKQWTACTLDGKVYYNCVFTETILIENKYVGFVEYLEGFSIGSLFYESACHSHFVAFSTDYDIDKLLEADVTFVSQSRLIDYVDPTDKIWLDDYSIELGGNIDPRVTCGEAGKKTVTLTYEDEVSFDTSSWFTKYSYSWSRIQTIDEFFNSVSDVNVYESSVLDSYGKTFLKESSKQKMSNMQYVLRFAETDFKVEYAKPYLTSSFGYLTQSVDTIISDVTILRLMFEKDGIVYNLGAVDNKTNGSGIPDTYTEWEIEVSEQFSQIMKIIGYVLFIILAVVALTLLSLFTPFLKIVWNVLKISVKSICYIFSAPFAFIKSLFKKGDG